MPLHFNLPSCIISLYRANAVPGNSACHALYVVKTINTNAKSISLAAPTHKTYNGALWPKCMKDGLSWHYTSLAFYNKLSLSVSFKINSKRKMCNFVGLE